LITDVVSHAGVQQLPTDRMKFISLSL